MGRFLVFCGNVAFCAYFAKTGSYIMAVICAVGALAGLAAIVLDALA